MAELVRRVDPSPVLRVPILAGDVHDLEGLERVAAYLDGSARFA